MQVTFRLDWDLVTMLQLAYKQISDDYTWVNVWGHRVPRGMSQTARICIGALCYVENTLSRLLWDISQALFVMTGSRSNQTEKMISYLCCVGYPVFWELRRWRQERQSWFRGIKAYQQHIVGSIIARLQNTKRGSVFQYRIGLSMTKLNELRFQNSPQSMFSFYIYRSMFSN